MLCFIRLAPLALLLLLIPSAAEAAAIYWSDSAGIHRANVDGSESLLLLPTEPYAIELDLDRGQMYFADAFDGVLRRADLDGTDLKTLVVEQVPSAYGLALDLVNDAMYWTVPEAFRVRRAPLEGGDPVDVAVTGDFLSYALGVAVDPSADHLYWSVLGEIWRSDLSGKGAAFFHRAAQGAVDQMAIDPTAGWLYWSQSTDDVGRGAGVWRVRLDGTDPTALVTFPDGSGIFPKEVALDTAAGKIYWIEDHGIHPSSVWQANLDGSDAQQLFEVGSRPFGLAIDNSIPGDANGDRLVNLDDFGILKTHFGAGTRRSQGDFNADHQVDLSDFGMLKQNFAGQGAAVPEPAAWLLLAIGGFATAFLNSCPRFTPEQRSAQCPRRAAQRKLADFTRWGGDTGLVSRLTPAARRGGRRQRCTLRVGATGRA